jgi:hypothetical protein
VDDGEEIYEPVGLRDSPRGQHTSTIDSTFSWGSDFSRGASEEEENGKKKNPPHHVAHLFKYFVSVC